ncbi:MAG: YbjN domain-containing protein [Maioricimonas sp. JB045]|uniref:YbjN domain-containing protein n=1 Tax=Maioricimonas sp. JC845 TaxID=3232138 RepID=UPI00345AD8BB
MRIISAIFVILITPGLATPVAAQPEAAAEPALLASFEDVVAVLERDGVPHQVNAEQQFVTIPTRRNGFQGVMLIRWAATDGVLHFVQNMPLQVPEDRRSDLVDAMVRLNHVYPVPGLGFNHATSTTYYRMTVPIQPRGGLTDRELTTYFNYALQQAINLLPTVKAVIDGDVAPDQVVAWFFNDQQRRQLEFPSGRFATEVAGATWTLELDGKGGAKLLRDGTVMVQSSYVTAGNRVTINDTEGDLACEGSGVYQWQSGSDGLRFSKLDDSCEGRSEILSAGPWRPVKSD